MQHQLRIFLTITSLCSLLFAPSSSFAQVPSYVPTNGLVGWWPFNGNANDESGNGNNGTVNGATLTTDRFGVANKAYSFDGVDDWFDVSMNQNNAFAVSIWVNYNVFTSTGIIWQHKNNCNRGGGFMLMNINGNLRFFSNDCGECSPGACSNVVELPNLFTFQLVEWYHIVLNKESTGNVTIFINGDQIFNNLNTINNINYGLQPFSIGKWHDGTDLYYTNAKKDDIGIWNRALTECEIRSLYLSGSGSITSHPNNLSVPLSMVNTAQFSVASSATSPTYKWQGNVGMGFVNLSDAGQYSGTTTNTLTVSNLTVANNDNQQFRCIVTDGNCEDTTDIAVLTVIDDLGIENITNNASKKFIKITDLNGKETPFRKNTVLLFIFEDGTIQRVFEAE
jgi:hypothetical protein